MHSVCTRVGIGPPPTPPPPQASVSLPQETKGAHSPAGVGVGESQFQRLEKRLSTLCASNVTDTYTEEISFTLTHTQ